MFCSKKWDRRLTNEKVINLIEKASNYTFPVYLMHYYVMDILRDTLQINVKFILWRVGGLFIIVAICDILTKVMRKILVLKNILP